MAAAARRRAARQDDRVRFSSAVQVDLCQTEAGVDLQFDQPDCSTIVRHGASIQCSTSAIDRLIGRLKLTADLQLDEASVSLTLVDRTDERVHLAGKAHDATVFTVGRAMMIAIEFAGWVDHADASLAYRHSGAMAGRIVLTGGRDQQDWSLTFLGDYKAAPVSYEPATNDIQTQSPTSAA